MDVHKEIDKMEAFLVEGKKSSAKKIATKLVFKLENDYWREVFL